MLYVDPPNIFHEEMVVRKWKRYLWWKNSTSGSWFNGCIFIVGFINVFFYVFIYCIVI